MKHPTALPTFLPPPGSFRDGVGEVLEFNVHGRPAGQGRKALSLREATVHLFQMPIQQVRLGGLHAARDHLIHRDTYGLGLRHRCRVTAGILEKRGESTKKGHELRGRAQGTGRRLRA